MLLHRIQLTYQPKQPLLMVIVIPVLLLFFSSPLFAQSTGQTQASPGQFLGAKQTTHPDWFKESFLEFEDDIDEATEQGKRLVIYFHQDGCPYCNKLVEDNFTHPDIAEKMQSKFDLVAINMWGDREVVNVGGKAFSEKTLAEALQVNFTPTLIFFDESRNVALRLNGYYPVVEFDHALNYVAQHKETESSFSEYLNSVKSRKSTGTLIQEEWIISPPHDLSSLSSDKPLAVLFEEPDCENCELLHQKTFKNAMVEKALNQYNIIQLNRWADDNLTTPDGEVKSASAWATELGLGFSPAIVLFDKSQQQIMTVDAMFKTFHIWGVLEYVATEAYKDQPSFQRYLNEQAEHLIEDGQDVNIWEY